MSDFVPMSETELDEVMAGKWEPHLGDVIASARHYLACAKAAEEARDLAIVERDEAYKQRDEARDERTEAWLERDDLKAKFDALDGGTRMGVLLEVSTVLGGAIGESVTQAAERVMSALAEARRERDEARKHLEGQKDECSDQRGRLHESRKQLDDLRNAIDDARAILGARPDELLSDAAQRVVDERDGLLGKEIALTTANANKLKTITEARQILGAAEGESLGNAAKRVNALADEARSIALMEWGVNVTSAMDQGSRGAANTVKEARDIIGARDLVESLPARARDVMAELRSLRERAGAEPPQVFRIIPRVTIGRDGVRFEVVTRDPGIRALTADQIARLGLVVCDE